jgi:hypothetical protein
VAKLILAGVIGAALGVLGTLGVQRARQERDNEAAHRTLDLFEVVTVVIERGLPGARVLDVAFQTPPTVNERYSPNDYEVLYDAHITYQLAGQVKKVVLLFGRTREPGTLIFPSTTEVVIADGTAEVMDGGIAARGTGMQPNNELQRTRPAQAMEPRR